MSPLTRRCLLGAVSGAIASLFLVPTLGRPWWGIILGVVAGAGYTASSRPTRHAYVDNLMAGGALGIPLWGLFSVIAFPVVSGQMPQWSAEEIRAHFPALVGWVLYGASLGLITQGLTDLTGKFLGPEAEKELPMPQDQ